MNVLKSIQDFFAANPSLPFFFREKLSQDARGEDAVVPMAVLAMGLADSDGASGSARITRISATGNITIANPDNPVDGKTISYEIKAVGADRQVTLGSAFLIPSSSSATSPFTVASGKTTILGARYNAAAVKWWVFALIQGY